MMRNLIAAATPLQRGLAVAAGISVLALLALTVRDLRKNDGTVSQPNASQSAAMPAIDADLPDRMETATFALG